MGRAGTGGPQSAPASCYHRVLHARVSYVDKLMRVHIKLQLALALAFHIIRLGVIIPDVLSMTMRGEEGGASINLAQVAKIRLCHTKAQARRIRLDGCAGRLVGVTLAAGNISTCFTPTAGCRVLCLVIVLTLQ